MMTKLADWLDERVGHRDALRRWLDHPLVGGASWAYVLGSLLAFDFAILVLTGAVLMTVYSPSVTGAWGSVHYISHLVPGGWLIRGMHFFAANAFVVLVGAHLAHVAAAGAYKKPHEVEWWLLLALAGLTMGAMISGGLLPWDQFGYWARRVEMGITGMAPIAGPFLQQMMQGGAEIGSVGLTRAYSVHVLVLPVIVVAILAWRGALARKHGYGTAAVAGGKTDPYYRQLSRNIVAASALLLVVFALAWRAHGAPLDAPADPASNYPARPEWFILPLFQLRKYFHGPGEFYGTALIPAAAGLYFFALPFLDKKPGAALTSRLVALLPAVAVAAAGGVLAMLALRKDASDAQFQKEKRQADERAAYAVELAMTGIPPQGALYMMQHDPELRGRALFEASCASCHVLGDLGDKKKANAPVLDGWSTESWLRLMIHDPDGDERFGRTPYKTDMPPADQPTADAPKPMLKGDAEVRAAALFLAMQGDEPGDPARTVDEAARKQGEKIVTKQCTTCHLWKGEGDDNGSGQAPELFRYGTTAWVKSQVTDPSSSATYREGALDPSLKGHMPRFDGELGPDDIDLVARWTRAHARGVALAPPKPVAASSAAAAAAPRPSSSSAQAPTSSAPKR
jgi:ubiquinol-cytochrome c reductase cytochrome b subunit